MKRLLIRPIHPDAETRRVTELLMRDADLFEMRDTHPARVLSDACRLRRHSEPGTLVHAFGLPALAAGWLIRGAKLVYSPIAFPGAREAAWLRAAMNYRPIEVICSSDTMRRLFVTRGVPTERCHLVRPGVRMGLIPTGRNRAVRGRFGFSDAETVILAPLEMTHTSGHGLACWAMSILQVLQPQYRLLIWGRGPAAELLNDFNSRLIDPDVVKIATDTDAAVEIEALYGAADAVLMTPSGPVSPLMVAMAMSSGRPIIATVTQQLCELLEDRHTALLVSHASPRLVAQKIIDLFGDQMQGWQIQDRARAEAYDLLTASRFVEGCESVYAKVSGERHSTDSPIRMNPIEA